MTPFDDQEPAEAKVEQRTDHEHRQLGRLHRFLRRATLATTTIEGLPSTDYSAIALDNAVSTIDQWILPDQIQLIADLAYAF